MKAIFINNNIVVGYHPEISSEELEAVVIEYDVVEEIPSSVSATPEGYYVERAQDGTYALVARPAEPTPELTPDQIRIEQLETQNTELMLAIAEMAEADALEKTEIQIAIAELAEMITGGV